jgi:protein involved in polysaccharide export with SLBB domain
MKSLCTALLLVLGNLVLCAQEKPAPVPDVPPATPAPTAPPAGIPPPALEPAKSPAFRAPGTGLKPGETVAPAPAPAAALNLSELVDRRKSLEDDIRANKSRIETAKQRAAVQQSLGKPEEVEKLKVEVQDYEARVRNSREQLAQLEEEIGRAQGATTERLLEDGEEAILPGNTIEVWVNEDPSFNGRYFVRQGGYILLPQVGRVQVAGKSISQAEATVRKALQATQLRRATVMIERFEGVVTESGPLIFLSGEFSNPRPYRIAAGTAPTLASVMLSCGGFTDRADLTKVRIMRVAGSSTGNRSITEEVNFKKMMDGVAGALANNVVLAEGDVIVVPPGSLSLVYVTGRVRKPGSYKLGENEKLTVYGLILQSGGFSPFANEKGVHVLRGLPDGGKAKIPVNIKDVKKGRRPDIIVQPGDIVVVPEKWFSW